ncbi:MAG: 30S ribosomal protein S20 [Candidatus Sungbacteria bacterium RIFCSPLOWO2_02_FULL_54_10]|uniref:Small ribosomal subunit protein bS20 n=2 Tax=Candidatus Sungiibacteriota TaxID=1817917 RepID=A0A1G2L800_9BACT|nr:MAG: 30S ribosomal protein S20 [Candidatus Sungbacteria bacterium RIFCSPHIGHO2_01_FULL_54_26]OHA03120.1 MAG: 30S ribosomal protein S20 [Candidatus Sungbacteria bacterium RIFCSPHIGHO2_02_FULL_53_17]OHA07690.1 MAG: 30S ribosomal protein S20 [Candidatus Sungbacteria bacterium RIFCSPLOWO2_01_FULL_54_21]OHA12212.1 MAG: 30S ribosomal protein S20 [Candidatus Sungbacteria bacterium RIFCSPLOWO2_02_FULL_54_10]
MPITTSAKKALRQSVRRKIRNTIKKDAYKDAVRVVRKFVSDGKIEDAKKALVLAYQALDKAAKTHAIKKNKAGRLKSRLTKFIGKSVNK